MHLDRKAIDIDGAVPDASILAGAPHVADHPIAQRFPQRLAILGTTIESNVWMIENF